jgi:hypothetical protein
MKYHATRLQSAALETTGVAQILNSLGGQSRSTEEEY